MAKVVHPEGYCYKLKFINTYTENNAPKKANKHPKIIANLRG